MNFKKTKLFYQFKKWVPFWLQDFLTEGHLIVIVEQPTINLSGKEWELPEKYDLIGYNNTK